MSELTFLCTCLLCSWAITVDAGPVRKSLRRNQVSHEMLHKHMPSPGNAPHALLHKAATSSAEKPRKNLGLKGFHAGHLNPDEVDFQALAFPYPYVVNWDRACLTGFFEVNCTFDVQKEQVRWYHEEIKREDRVPMTPDVCYDFCYRIPGAQFFGLVNGDKCYCTPFWQQDLSAWDKRSTENAGICDMPCVGDPGRMCGGKELANIYGMHSCEVPSTTTSTTTPPCEPSTITAVAIKPDDDTEMSLKSGEMYQGSGDLELGLDPDDVPWGQQFIGIRFEEVDVPIGARITEAHVEFTNDGGSRRRRRNDGFSIDDPLKANIKMVRLPNVLTFKEGKDYLARLPTTSQLIEWQVPKIEDEDGKVQSPDVHTLVQEVVDQGGWKARNAMAMTMRSTGGHDDKAFRRFLSVEGGGGAKLTVSYCALGGCEPTSISVKIGDDLDDVEEFKKTGEMYMDSSDLELGLDHDFKSDGQVMIGLRFKDVQVPANARILSANIELTLDDIEAEEEPGTHDPISATIKMILQPDVAAFQESKNYLTKLPATLHGVSWSPPDYGDIPGDYAYGGSGTPTDHTPDIGKLVHEVVHQGGWKAGNTMAVTLDAPVGANSEAVRRFWGAKLKKGPKLTIWYCSQ